jgi:hypothetical protein
MPFLNAAILSVCDESGKWMLVRPLHYRSVAGELIIIPAGFLTDLASIPRAFHWLIPVNGKHRAPAILHDYLFVVQDRPRADVDALFLEAMAGAGVRWTQRTAMYAAVRLGGWVPWQHNTRSQAGNREAFLAQHGIQPSTASETPNPAGEP